MASRPDTKKNILDAAEMLFAQNGFVETSLRSITSTAEVNLASVNYHFGSKKSLIQSVLARYLDIIMPLAASAVTQLSKDKQQAETPSLERIFSALVEPLLSLEQLRPDGTRIFLQLLGRGYIETQGHLRWFITTHYEGELQQLLEAITHSSSVPHISVEDLFWRLHFSLGAIVFTMASAEALTEIAAADFDQGNSIEDIIRRMIPYLAAGVSADS